MVAPNDQTTAQRQRLLSPCASPRSCSSEDAQISVRGVLSSSSFLHPVVAAVAASYQDDYSSSGGAVIGGGSSDYNSEVAYAYNSNNDNIVDSDDAGTMSGSDNIAIQPSTSTASATGTSSTASQQQQQQRDNNGAKLQESTKLFRSDSSVFITGSRSTIDTDATTASSIKLGLYRPLEVEGASSLGDLLPKVVGRGHNGDDGENYHVNLLPSLSLDTLDNTNHQHHLMLSTRSGASGTFLGKFNELIGDDEVEESDLTLTQTTSIGQTSTIDTYDEFIEEEDENAIEELKEFADFLTCGKTACCKEEITMRGESGGGGGGILDSFLSCFGCGTGTTVDDAVPLAAVGSGIMSVDDASITSEVSQSPSTNKPTIEELYRHCIKLISEGRYDKFVQICRAVPAVLTFRAPEHGRTTVVHVLARSERNPNENIIMAALSQDVSCVAIPDREGNLPLHTLAANWGAVASARSSLGEGEKDEDERGGVGNASKLGLLNDMVKIFPGAAAVQNENGELPLHLLLDFVDSGHQVVDESIVAAAVFKLLEANSRAVGVPSGVMGRTPLHIAYARGSCCSVEVILALLGKHKKKKIGIATPDRDGNTPLHLAIKSGAPYETIEIIIRDPDPTFLSAYLQKDQKGDLPLHTCLKNRRSFDCGLPMALINASPFSATCRNKEGDMPIQLATSFNADDTLIKAMLELDMPIEIGTQASSSQGTMVERQHGHSWWHVAVDCQDRYIDMIDNVLSPLSLAEIIALSKSVGPDCVTSTRQASPPQLASLFHDKLGFLDRFELIGETTLDRRVIATDAVDHGRNKPYARLPEGVSAVLYDGGFSEIRGQLKSARNDVDDGFEIALGTTSGSESAVNEDRLVSLRCYEVEKEFRAEMNIRRTLDSAHTTHSLTFIERILDSFEGTRGHVNPSHLYCIAFEEQSYTLEEMLNEPENENGTSISWLAERRELFKQVGRALRYLHKGGIIHANLGPDCVARFGEQWKLTNIGQAVILGSSIGGSFRYYAPPEHLIDPTKPCDDVASLAYTPRTCVASPSWDVFAYGELMARVLLETSTVLPVHEKESVAIMKRLARFNKDSIDTLRQALSHSAGDLASDLIARLVEPNPDQRLRSISKALSHRFFHDDTELFAQPDSANLIGQNKQTEQEIQPCPSSVETEIVLNCLDALAEELKDMPFKPDSSSEDEEDSAVASVVAPSVAPSTTQSIATTRMTNMKKGVMTRKVTQREVFGQLPPPPQSPTSCPSSQDTQEEYLHDADENQENNRYEI